MLQDRTKKQRCIKAVSKRRRHDDKNFFAQSAVGGRCNDRAGDTGWLWRRGGSVALTRDVATTQSVQTAKESRTTGALTSVATGDLYRGARLKSVKWVALWKRQAALVVARPGAHRDTTTSYDSSLGLWFKSTSNADGSARVDAYTDEALTHNVGYFAVDAPKWSGQVGTLPASVHLSYNISAGEHPGSGSIDVTINSLNSDTGSITSGHLKASQKDAKANQNATYDLALSSTGITGPVRFTNSAGWTQLDLNAPLDTDTTAAITSSYGMKGSLVLHTDTSGNLSLTNTSGAALLTMDWNADGSASITYPDGSTKTIDNVDTQ